MPSLQNKCIPPGEYILMPELPEVETIKRDLELLVLNKTIVETLVLLEKSLLNPMNIKIEGKIIKIQRIGKYIIIYFENFYLLIHLRMTGKLIYFNNSQDIIHKHTRIIFKFADSSVLIFNDIRTFGRIECGSGSIHLEKLGIDALDIKNIISSKKPIKLHLLNQSEIAGIGNIYAQEILFSAKISPLRLTQTLTNTEKELLITKIKDILHEAIKENGTTISDYRRIDNKSGNFQNFLKVYGKVSCPICEKKLTIIKQAGRTTRYCDSCQK